MRSSFLWIVVACLVFHLSPAQQHTASAYHPEKKYPLAQLQDDFWILKKALEEAHPGLYTFHATSEFISRFDSIHAGLQEDQTELDFFGAVTGLVSGIGCGHTSCSLSKAYTNNYEEKQAKLFPFEVKIVDHRVYLFSNFSTDSTIPNGSELLELNGQSTQTILHLLLPHIPGDGVIEGLKYHILEKDFSLIYSEFISQPEWFSLRFRMPGEELMSVRSLPGLHIPEIKKIKKKRTSTLSKQITDAPPLNFQLTDDKIGVLTIHSFDNNDITASKQKFKSFLRHTFDTLKYRGVNDLVIDLRNNEGGDDDFGWYLYSFLTDSAFRYYDRIELASKKKYSYQKFFSKKLICRSLRFLSSKASTGHIEWKHGSDTHIHQPGKNHFAGQVYVLINGGSFSTTAEFAAICQFHQKAIFIGEETGGAYEGNNSGLFTILTLPNTHIRVKIPLFRYYMAVDTHHPTGRGVIPDVAIPLNINDVLKGVDTQKEYVIDYIRRKNCKGCSR